MEDVLVISIESLLDKIENGMPSLIVADDYSYLRNSSFFMKRCDAESNQMYKQIIPYVVVRYDDYLFWVTRTNQQTESRLHNKSSIGIGGHINPVDMSDDPIMSALYREVQEELEIDLDIIRDIRFNGLINDDTTDVGKVHLGLFFEITLQTDKVSIKEKDKMVGRFRPIDSLNDIYSSMETWSMILMDSYYYG